VHGFAVHRVHAGSIETLTDLRGNPDRTTIVGCNEAEDTAAASVARPCTQRER
jgi:hypothetical protein